MTPNHIIFGVHITDRVQQASEVQDLLTTYGQHIKTRLGLHDQRSGLSKGRGVVVLEMAGEEATCCELRDKLAAIPGIEVQQMIFTHD
jgi:hypothetical protein